MKPHTNPIEQAFELARSGKYVDVSEIIGRMRFEGYATETITGPLLFRQLTDRINKARTDQRKPVSKAHYSLS